MTKRYSTLVYIGRFQPVHSAHAEIIRRASELADQLVIIVGSANQPRTYKNPWTSAERAEMLQEAISDEAFSQCQIAIEHNTDTIYNDQAWAARIQSIVSRYRLLGGNIGIIGHKKDESSYYLDMFPQWELVEVPLIEPLNATNIRDLYFRRDANMKFIKNVVPTGVWEFLNRFRDTAEYQQVIREREYIEVYRKQFAGLAYPPIFVTVDACLIQSGHVLMIRRRSEPGRGLWALPGGFLNANTDASVKDAMLRELREETGIKVPAPVLAGNITGSRVFDAVDRSARGRTITHAFRITLPDGALPRVKGQDDADKARWVPIAEIKSEECFEDHFEMVQWALGA